MGITFCKCKGFEMSQLYKTNKELRCGDFVLKQNFQLLDHPLLSYKVAATMHLQSVSLFSSSNGFTHWLPSVPLKMPNKWMATGPKTYTATGNVRAKAL